MKLFKYVYVKSVHYNPSVVSDFLRPHGLQQRQASLSITNSRTLLKVMSIESLMLSSHLILCRPLLLPSIFPSIRGFSNESVNQMATVLELQLQHQSFQWIFRISFRVNRLDGLAVQGALKSLLQHNLKASILRCSSLWSNSHTHTWLLEKS